MDTLEVTTDVRVPPSEAYAFLEDFPGYARYSKYLESVRQHGDGGPGTEYDLTFSWWKLSQTFQSRVTDTAEPSRIDWEVLGTLDASGQWLVEETPDGCRVSLVVTYDSGSARGVLDLPVFASFDWVAQRVVEKIAEEGERVVERVVADLEGAPRDVDLDVETR